MTAFETMMWRGEVDPRLRSTGTILHVLDSVPDWDRLVSAHERGTRFIPRLREQVVEPALPIAPPGWAEDEHFDLGYHLRRMALPAPGTFRQLLDVTRSFGQTPLDRGRPQWEALLIEGLEGGRAAYVFKFHHALSDGHGFIQLLSMTLNTGREPQPRRVDAGQGGRVTPVGLLGAELKSASADLARGAWRSFGQVGSALRHPVDTVTDGVEFARSLGRVMSGPDPDRSSLLARSSGLGWDFAAHELPLEQLKAAAKAAGGSVNDAYVAGLLGGLRRYHEECRQPVDRIPVGMPVSVRAEGDPLGGNKFAAARFEAPIGEPDPLERIRLVREFVLNARTEVALTALDDLSPLLSRLPTAAIVKLTADFANTLDAQASNVPGMAREAYLAGAKVTNMYPFGPRPGCAAMFALFSHNGTCCVGANVDPEAITDIELFERCLREGFDEVLKLA
jgi:WS/DGAT/MGAT family acyltransferase